MAKVMVIDDDPGIIEVVEVMLSLDGHAAAHSQDSSAALERVRQEAPDLILLDLMMPFVDGWQVLAALRRDRQTQAIPVVMLTARADLEQAKINPAGWGLADFVVKPFDFESLSNAIRKGLSAA
ncbi:MAG: response regulator [Chloroflexi bacterium]|nr:response regulator [Chloroflexota bacterium]